MGETGERRRLRNISRETDEGQEMALTFIRWDTDDDTTKSYSVALEEQEIEDFARAIENKGEECENLESSHPLLVITDVTDYHFARLGSSSEEGCREELSPRCGSEEPSPGSSSDDAAIGTAEPSPRSVVPDGSTVCRSTEPTPWSSSDTCDRKEPSAEINKEEERKKTQPFPFIVIELEMIRRQGNEELKKKNFSGATHMYTRCIEKGEHCLLDPSSSQDIIVQICKTLKLAYANRAQLLLNSNQFDKVLNDTECALVLDHDHAKSLFRKGKALHCLQQFQQACQAFSAALALNPKSMQVAAALHESMKSHQQSISGEYDISHFLLHSGSPPECSDYVGPVEIREAPYAGRGLFVTQQVEAGSLLLVSNALGIASTPTSDTQADLSLKVAEILMHKAQASSRWKHQLYYLTGGKPEQDTLGLPEMKLFIPGSDWSPDPDQDIEISFSDVVKRVAFNTFDASRALADGVEVELKGKPRSSRSSGVWVLPSFLNHSCIPTCTIMFVGKAMFVRAAQNLEAGDELTTSYTACSAPDRRSRIKSWKFDCNCQRCQQDLALEPHLKDLREELEYHCTFLSRHNTKKDKLRALFKTIEMVDRLETVIQSLSVVLDTKHKNWVRATFMTIYNNDMQVSRVSGDLTKKIQALWRLAEIQDSINGGGVHYASLRFSSHLLCHVQKRFSPDSDEFNRTKKQVMQVFKTALGDMGEPYFTELIKVRYGSHSKRDGWM